MPDAANSAFSGAPSKDFFVSMITRDLSLIDCILDLVDNSVDQAVADSKIDVASALTAASGGSRFRATVSLSVGESEFRIKDDCSGISIDDARDRVFRFGDPQERGAVGGLSVYGIGMKRAFFKLGRKILVESRQRRERFEVAIDVNAWKAQPPDDWDFHAVEATAAPSTAHTGTTISITSLTAEASRRFEQKSFSEELRRRLSTTYSLFLSRGLTLNLDGRTVRGALPSTARDSRVTPARKRIHEGGVDIVIIAGVTPRDSKASGGWYVFCNGRLVLEGDKTSTTGWGDGLPQWHTKFGHFVGYVSFHSSDVRNLPWTTTKQGVVVESDVWQAALAEMRVQARPVLKLLTSMYPEDLEPETDAARRLLNDTRAVPLTRLARSDVVFKASLPPRAVGLDALVSISYKKPRKLVELAKRLAGRQLTNPKLGELTFDYFLEHEEQ